MLFYSPSHLLSSEQIVINWKSVSFVVFVRFNHYWILWIYSFFIDLLVKYNRNKNMSTKKVKFLFKSSVYRNNNAFGLFRFVMKTKSSSFGLKWRVFLGGQGKYAQPFRTTFLYQKVPTIVSWFIISEPIISMFKIGILCWCTLYY